MKDRLLYPGTLLVLAATATLLPPFPCYVLCFLLLLWLVSGGRWRFARPSGLPFKAGTRDQSNLLAALAEGVRPIDWGVCLFIAAMLVSGVIGTFFSDYAQSFPVVTRVSLNLVLKLGLTWLVLSGAMIVLVRRGFTPGRVAPWLAAWLAVHFVYCLAQRATGVDWVHGFHAVLEGNRFAYGVYRVSGFMSHPLTLGYNLVLTVLAAAAMLFRTGTMLLRRERWAWGAVLVLALLTLLISGSRFVLVVLVVTLAVCEGRRALCYKWWLAGGAALTAVILWLEGSMIGRYRELFNQKVPLTQRFHRLEYWRLHAQMFLDHPMFGVTLAGRQPAAIAYYTAAGNHDNLYIAHNIFLQILADSGLLGFFGLVAFFIGLTMAARRLCRHAGQGISYLIVATLVSGLMQNNLRDSGYLYALWFYLGLLLVQSASLAARPAGLEVNERESSKNLESGAGA